MKRDKLNDATKNAPVAAAPKKDERPHLKKNNFLAVVPYTPTTMDQLKELLTGFQYLPAFLDFLVAHFVAQGKITETVAGIHRTAPKSGGATTKHMFLVDVEYFADGDDNRTGGFRMVKATPDSLNMSIEEMRDNGWRLTTGAAIKEACSAVFKTYKTHTATIKALDSVSEDDMVDMGEPSDPPTFTDGESLHQDGTETIGDDHED